MPILSSVYSVLTISWFLSLAFLLAVVTAAGWWWSRLFASETSDRIVFSALIGLHVPALAVLLPLPFNLGTIGMLSAVLFGGGWVLRKKLRRAGIEYKYSSSIYWNFSITVFLFICSIMIFRVNLFTHYDYYLSSNLLSLDLARSGSAASAFAVQHDLHNWPLIQLTTTVALDALEILALSTNTNLLPRLLLLLTIVSIAFLLRRRSVLSGILFTVFGIFVFIDQSTFYRPHIFVGLYLSMACILYIQVPGRIAVLIAVAIFLVLAKRDGLVLAPMLLLLWPRLRIDMKSVLAALLLCAAAAMFLQVRGQSPLVALWQSLSSWDAISQALARFGDFGLLSAMTVIVMLLINRDRVPRMSRPAVLALAVFAFSIATSLILSGAGVWNAGTNERKLLYVVGPLVITLSFLHADFSRKLTGRSIALGLASLVFLSWTSVQMGATLRAVPAWEAMSGNIAFMRKLLPRTETLKIGALEDDFHALSLTLFGDLQGYKFQFFIAYLGSDLRIEPSLEDLGDRDVTFISSTSLEGITDVPADHALLFPFGDYALLTRNDAIPTINPELLRRDRTGAPLTTAFTRQYIQPFDAEELSASGLSANQFDYPAGFSAFSVSDSGGSSQEAPAATIQVPAGKEVTYITFRDPVGGVAPDFVRLALSDEIYDFEVQSLKQHDTYYLPVFSNRPFEISFSDKDESGLAWLAMAMESREDPGPVSLRP